MSKRFKIVAYLGSEIYLVEYYDSYFDIVYDDDIYPLLVFGCVVHIEPCK